MSVSIATQVDHSVHLSFLWIAANREWCLTPALERDPWDRGRITKSNVYSQHSHSFSKPETPCSALQSSRISGSATSHASRSEQAHKQRLAENINQGMARGIVPPCNAKEIMNSNGHSFSAGTWNTIWLWERWEAFKSWGVLWGPECQQHNQDVGPRKLTCHEA